MISLHHHYIHSFGLTIIPTVIDAETEGQLEEVTGLKLKALTRTQGLVLRCTVSVSFQ